MIGSVRVPSTAATTKPVQHDGGPVVEQAFPFQEDLQPLGDT
jgi:hypothetical protein